MIIKQRPEDFRVVEETDLAPQGQGTFSFYVLEKKGWTTADALALVRRRWKIDHRRLSYGGLKDRHAFTRQHFTIFRGPERNLNQQGVRVGYLGKLDQPFSSQHIRANRFELVLRNLPAEKAEVMREDAQATGRIGLPNYFDDQRFGSVRGGNPFPAKSLILGRPEEALRLALTSAYPFDPAGAKQEKALLRRHWGDWGRLREELGRSHARSLVDYLAHHPDDFGGAFDRMRPELRTLHLSAYQSHLWNRMLASWLGDLFPSDQVRSVDLALGTVPMPTIGAPDLLERLRAADLPLHSPRMVPSEDDPIRPYFDRVLREEGIEIERMKLKGMEVFFTRGTRPAWCMPAGLTVREAADETRPGRRKLELAFALPRGSYATLVVKRLDAAPG